MSGGVQAIYHRAKFTTNMDPSHLGLELLVAGWLPRNVSRSFSSCLAGVRHTFLVTYSLRIQSRRCPPRLEALMDSTETLA